MMGSSKQEYNIQEESEGFDPGCGDGQSRPFDRDCGEEPCQEHRLSEFGNSEGVFRQMRGDRRKMGTGSGSPLG